MINISSIQQIASINSSLIIIKNINNIINYQKELIVFLNNYNNIDRN